MAAKLKLEGRRFGKLLVMGRAESPEHVKNKDQQLFWKCVCDCGSIRTVRGSSLTTGNTISCGCAKVSFLKSRIKEKNHKWRGDKASKYPLHAWLSRNKPRPDVCEWCRWDSNIELSFDHSLGKHTRNPDDYLWLCKSCHALRDRGQAKAKPLTRARIHRIREFYGVGAATLRELGKLFHVGYCTIADIINYKNRYQEVTHG